MSRRKLFPTLARCVNSGFLSRYHQCLLACEHCEMHFPHYCSPILCTHSAGLQQKRAKEEITCKHPHNEHKSHLKKIVAHGFELCKKKRKKGHLRILQQRGNDQLTQNRVASSRTGLVSSLMLAICCPHIMINGGDFEIMIVETWNKWR